MDSWTYVIGLVTSVKQGSFATLMTISLTGNRVGKFGLLEFLALHKTRTVL